jgi:hypothetical protein
MVFIVFKQLGSLERWLNSLSCVTSSGLDVCAANAIKQWNFLLGARAVSLALGPAAATTHIRFYVAIGPCCCAG